MLYPPRIFPTGMYGVAYVFFKLPHPLLELFPLNNIPESTLKSVCQAVWEWRECRDRGTDGTCTEHACPWKRHLLLEHFLEFYN